SVSIHSTPVCLSRSINFPSLSLFFSFLLFCFPLHIHTILVPFPTPTRVRGSTTKHKHRQPLSRPSPTLPEGQKNPNQPKFNSITATSIPSPWLIFSFLHHQTDHTRRSLRQLLPT
ncbi:hypothetical protein CCUS01_17276, partial [Colletotrichum cuscutae]